MLIEGGSEMVGMAVKAPKKGVLTLESSQGAGDTPGTALKVTRVLGVDGHGGPSAEEGLGSPTMVSQPPL